MKRTEVPKWKQFLVTFIMFAFLGVCFKVMVLVKGFTEVRPANGVPVPAGLCCGWIGGVACAFGNLFSDFFGTLAPSSSVGFIGNFAAAYMPYKLWYVFTDEEPNVHSIKNMLIYLLISFTAALAVAWMIGSGLWLLFGTPVENISLYIFMNDFVFSVVLGLPVFIVLTSDEFKIVCAKKPKDVIKLSAGKRRIMTAVYTLILAILFVMTQLGYESLKPAAYALSAPALIMSVILML